jgi:uncharacterized NAD(P)/FAD-binding protein YdhS
VQHQRRRLSCSKEARPIVEESISVMRVVRKFQKRLEEADGDWEKIKDD